MPSYSFVVYAGDGGTGPFAVPFAYLDQSHVTVSVDGVAVAHSWPTAASVSLSSGAASGAVVEIRRTTPRDARLVDFTDGAILTEADLDTAILQQMYLAQEALDAVENTATLASDGTLDAGGLRISNVADPSGAQDAATKAYADQVAATVLANAAAATGIVFASAPADGQLLAYQAADQTWTPVDPGLTDGDKGDISVAGESWTIDAGAVDSAKLADGAVTSAKIAAAAKSGLETTLATGSAGAADRAAMWNADGDLVEIVAAAGDALPLTAPDGAGNLAADVATLGALVGAVDGLTLGGWSVAQAETATNSGSSFDVTGIPATARVIRVLFSDVSLSGSDLLLVQLGDSGGIETSGYRSGAARMSSSGLSKVNSTAGLAIHTNGTAYVVGGVMTLSSADGLTWRAAHSADFNTQLGVGGGIKTLSSALTQLRITPDGSDTFDAGAFSVIYQ